MNTQTFSEKAMDELTAMRAAWERAQTERVHQVVVDARPLIEIRPLPSLQIARGETILALVSPTADYPGGRPTDGR